MDNALTTATIISVFMGIGALIDYVLYLWL